MKRVIVDYAKLTNEILNLLIEKFPDGYDDSNIVRFRNAKNELVEAVEVRTEDTIYLVKVSTKLATRLENFDEDEIDDVAEPIDSMKDISIEDDEAASADDEEEEEDDTDKPEYDDEDDEDGEKEPSDVDGEDEEDDY